MAEGGGWWQSLMEALGGEATSEGKKGGIGTSDIIRDTTGVGKSTPQSTGFDWDQFFKDLSGMKITPVSPGSGVPSTGPAPEGVTLAPAQAATLPQGGRLSFFLSPRQESLLGARFGANTEAKRKYIIERILSGDRSLAPYTPEQMYAARTQSAQAPQAQQSSAFEALVRSVGSA